jgi:hypothetical protein
MFASDAIVEFQKPSVGDIVCDHEGSKRSLVKHAIKNVTAAALIIIRVTAAARGFPNGWTSLR